MYYSVGNAKATVEFVAQAWNKVAGRLAAALAYNITDEENAHFVPPDTGFAPYPKNSDVRGQGAVLRYRSENSVSVPAPPVSAGKNPRWGRHGQDSE